MDPIVTTAATALVGAMTTDAWEHVHTALVSWWRRIRPQQADSVDAELEQSRHRALTAHREQDADGESELVAVWENRLTELLGENRELAEQLRRLVDRDIPPYVHHEHVHQDTGKRTGTQETRVEASGSARVFIAGRDQHIHEP
ncbi:hypothetical protein [Streptomyces sp. GbtcB6]|uniref:hypothetical protein n=1 Tax=Streptomyces sp. GbtcB6 TaxID=2824751 RepID=UPI001C2F6DDF|nr:hypothetical protein [Streptomyces sp. GbtcB6]